MTSHSKIRALHAQLRMGAAGLIIGFAFMAAALSALRGLAAVLAPELTSI